MSISRSIDMSPHFNHQVASVPKGFLRYYILKLLDEGPKSGSEIVQEINIRTEGLWKPSPGSIYPLLSRLKEKLLVQEIEENEPGLKRYTLTEKGREILQEMIEDKEDARKKTALLIPSYIGSFESGAHPQEIIELNKSVRNLLTVYWDFLNTLRERYSIKTVEAAIEAVNQSVRSIDELIRSLTLKNAGKAVKGEQT